MPYPPPPSSPGVVLKGWAYPLSDVVFLQDGVEKGKASANNNAEFGGFLSVLYQGVYTFGVWANDSEGRRSITVSTTFWIDAGTQTTVSDIILPPTIAISSNSIDSGQLVRVYGQTIPSTTIEVWLQPDKDKPDESEILKSKTISDAIGRWELYINTDGLADGAYQVKARTFLSDILFSEFGQVIKLGIGAQVPGGGCPGADLNGDGRVNITDFSILLYWWGTDNECADQNQDGIVDLIDFSIMMFYWTG